MNDENRRGHAQPFPVGHVGAPVPCRNPLWPGVPALGWAVTRELISAGFVSYGATGRTSLSITLAGRAFMKSRASPLRLTQDTIATAWPTRPPGANDPLSLVGFRSLSRNLAKGTGFGIKASELAGKAVCGFRGADEPERGRGQARWTSFRGEAKVSTPESLSINKRAGERVVAHIADASACGPDCRQRPLRLRIATHKQAEF